VHRDLGKLTLSSYLVGHFVDSQPISCRLELLDTGSSLAIGRYIIGKLIASQRRRYLEERLVRKASGGIARETSSEIMVKVVG